MSPRHRFTEAELEQYFDRICLPQSARVYDVTSLDDAAKLEYMNTIQKHQLVKIPWENCAQHYSWHHVVHVEPAHLFRKIVQQRGRGGYCMEANYFIHLILHSLRFDAYMAGSRIFRSPEAGYGGWTHVVNIVTIAGVRYLLDGGFGSPGPTHPIPLIPGAVRPQISPAESRVVYEALPDGVSSASKLWIYQYRFHAQDAWKAAYCFTDLEFLPADIVGMNLQPWLDRHTFFTHKVVACRFTTDRETEEGAAEPGSASEEALVEGEIDGAITLAHDVIKWRRRGQKVTEVHFASEEERLAGIRKYFGVVFSDEDAAGIKGTAACIGANAPVH